MTERTRSIAEIFADDAVIGEALARGVREALLKHAQAGNPVSAWKDGRVVWIQPEEIFTLLSREREIDWAQAPSTW